MNKVNLTPFQESMLNNPVNLENRSLIVSSADDSYGCGEILIIEEKDVIELRSEYGDLWVEFIDTERDNEQTSIPIYDFVVIQKH